MTTPRSDPSAIVYSSGGLYGATHLPVALLEKTTGIPKLRHLPTNGGGPAITALLGNNAQMTTQTVSASLSHVKAGKLRPLASLGGKRSKKLPDVPTLKELGYDAEYYLWVGIFAPKGTAPADCSTLNWRDRQSRASSEVFKAALTNAGLGARLSRHCRFRLLRRRCKRSDDGELIGRVQGERPTPASACWDAIVDHCGIGARAQLFANRTRSLVALARRPYHGRLLYWPGPAVDRASGDLPTGNLSMPGSGFLPKIVAVLTIFFGAVLVCTRARK